MFRKEGLSYVQLLMIMAIISTIAVMSLASWQPPRDEYGNVVYTKAGRYLNEFEVINESQIEYERHVDEYKGGTRIVGADMENLNISNALSASLLQKIFDKNNNGNVDNVPITVEIYKGSDINNESNMLWSYDTQKIVKDGQLFVVEWGDR